MEFRHKNWIGSKNPSFSVLARPQIGILIAVPVKEAVGIILNFNYL
ncbi:hypothetical protein ADIS_1729 [Lunatimonas lonarensis]|uniref:Uncharacterized protein n=1 Tax=Lunatimonas lonarensis TaxID=1232681 RepID=R7ZUI3_9BACT|nr:hypothetical protein ADIS_1729 [Lunatimonas lonarensis]